MTRMLRSAGFNCSCDICDRFLFVPSTSEAAARANLARHGWESTDLDICKSCVEKRNAGVDGIVLLIDKRRRERAAMQTGTRPDAG